MVEFSIAPTGKVENPHPKEHSSNAALDACIAKTFAGFTFPFVRENLVDIGDRVTEGQVLAVIDAPETSEEIRLAKARLAEARANVGLVAATSDRVHSLTRSGAASQQEADDAQAQSNSASALVATRRAEVRRLQALRGYQKIVAPFAGVVTRRLVDPGALVGPASAGGVAMFEIAAIDELRVLVDVPDAHAADVGLGVAAHVYSPRDPARKVEGAVSRTSGVLEEATRTLRIEVFVAGGDVVLPGAFVYVTLHVPRRRPAPSAAVRRRAGRGLRRRAGRTRDREARRAWRGSGQNDSMASKAVSRRSRKSLSPRPRCARYRGRPRIHQGSSLMRRELPTK